MKRGFKALSVLAAVAMALAGPQAFAVCAEFGGYAVFQCGERAYFEPPPAGSGAVSAAFFQTGFGNNGIATGLGTAGTGMDNLTTFAGNDNGLALVDVGNAATIIGDSRVPAGSLCLRSNNWGNAGIDGCCDNPRDVSLQMTDDDILNPLYNVYYSRAFGYTYASNDWIQDYPMATLLTEANGNWFALAAVASVMRSGPTDIRHGEYNYKAITNGHTNPIDGTPDVVPWQAVPGNGVFVTGWSYTNTADTSSDRLVDLSWNDVTLYSDNSSRPSTNSTVTSGGAGVSEMGNLIRYVVETQTVADGSMDPFPQLVEGNWVADSTYFNPTNSASGIQVPINTCIRLHTLFGKSPQTSSHSPANCRLGKCGDLGYAVASRPACIGGPLIADGVPKNLKAVRGKGNVDVTWSTDTELSVSRFDISVVEKDGSSRLVSSTSCKKCSDGTGADYSVELKMGDLKGARTIEVKAVGPNASKSANIK